MRSTKNPIVITMTGAGGSGKSIVSRELKTFFGDRVVVAPSFTRKGYETAHTVGLRVPNEAAALAMSAEELGLFQNYLFENYIKEAREFIRLAKLDSNVEAVILERSPFDYIAYIRTQVLPGFYHFPTLLKTARAFNASFNPWVVYFPHNSPWYQKGLTQDGMRKVDPVKDNAFDVDLVALLCTEKMKQAIYLDTWDFNERVNRLVRLINHPENEFDHSNPQGNPMGSGDSRKDSPNGVQGAGSDSRGPAKSSFKRAPRPTS